MSYKVGYIDGRAVLAVQCDMDSKCTEPVTHVDNKGYVYCLLHGNDRKFTTRCRRLTSSELKTVKNGEPLSEY